MSDLPSEVAEDLTNQIEETTGELGSVKQTNDILNKGAKDGEKTSERKASELKTLTNFVGDQAFMDKASQDGLNARQIVTLKTLADQTGKTLTEVLTVYEANNKDMGATLKALSVKPQEIYKGINSNFKSVKQDINSDFKDSKSQTEKANENSAKKDVETTVNGKGASSEHKSVTEAKPEQKAQGKSDENRDKASISEKVSSEIVQQPEVKKDAKENNGNGNASEKGQGNGKK